MLCYYGLSLQLPEGTLYAHTGNRLSSRHRARAHHIATALAGVILQYFGSTGGDTKTTVKRCSMEDYYWLRSPILYHDDYHGMVLHSNTVHDYMPNHHWSARPCMNLSLQDAVLNAGGTVVKTPQPGDLVFFSDYHVGIMTDSTNCISGNMSSPSRVRTCKVEWVVPGSTIVYVRPAYVATAYRVAFKANGGTGKMGAQTIKKNATKALKANAFTRTGYTFTGWNTKADGTGTAYANSQKVKNLTKAGKTIKLYAQWKKAPYKVAFKANGGKGTMSTQKIKRGKAVALKANSFKRAGYKFVGWNTKKNGSGKSYKNGQTVKNIAKAGKTIKLYAQWKKKA